MSTHERTMRPWLWYALVVTCAIGQTTGQEWRQLAPPDARQGHVVAFDSDRGCTVMWGGTGPAGLLADTWELHGTAWQHVPTAVSPPARQQHAMVYDAARHVVVMFGGFGAGTLDDTWEYDGATWTLASPSTSPTPRYAHSMIYDAVRGVVVVFGGVGGAFLNDTWEYDGTTWTEISTSGTPPPRMAATMAYDVARQRVVLFGGTRTMGLLGDTWEYDGVQRTWTETTPATDPTPRRYATMTYCSAGPLSGQIVLFGGSDGTTRGDTWTYTGSPPTWTELSPLASPPARLRHAMAFDPSAGCVLFGGSAAAVSNETWSFDGVTWRALGSTAVPPVRHAPGVAYDVLSDRMLLFGGVSLNPTVYMTDTWELDGQTWSEIQTATLPPGRSWRPWAYDTRRACAVVFGGFEQNGSTWSVFADTWEFDSRMRDWVQRSPTHSPPPRMNMSMTYDMRRGRVVLFGGFELDGGGNWVARNDTWEYDGNTWTEVPTAHAPSARFGSLAYDARRDVVVLFGGAVISGGGAQPLGETWEYDGRDWTLRSLPREPSPRWVFVTYDAARGRILLFGGFGRVSGRLTAFDDTWEYDGSNWSPVNVPMAPSARGNGVLAYDPAHGRELLAFGMSAQETLIDGCWEFQPAAVPTFARYGFGCDGRNGLTPSLDAASGSVPRLGDTFALELTDLTPVASAFVLGFGFDLGQFGGLSLPLDLGLFGMRDCDLWVGFDPALTLIGTHPGNRRELAFRIPNDPNLDGLRLGMQAICFDALAPNGCAALTNAGIATIH